MAGEEQVIEQETVEDLMDSGETGILENDPLSSIFGDTSEETVIEEEVVTATEDEKVIEETVVTAEEPKEIPKVEKDPDSGWKAAYFAEKNKRQTLEKEKPVEEPQPFDWTNPEKTIESIKTDLNQGFQDKFLNMSQAQCQARNEDYGEKYQAFIGMAQENNAIIQTMLAQPDPAQWAYDQASQKMFVDEVGADPTAYREKIAAEERTKMGLEFNKKAGDKKALVDSLPPSASSLSDNVPHAGVQKEPFDALFPGQVAS